MFYWDPPSTRRRSTCGTNVEHPEIRYVLYRTDFIQLSPFPLIYFECVFTVHSCVVPMCESVDHLFKRGALSL